jgi:hypothetical protein
VAGVAAVTGGEITNLLPGYNLLSRGQLGQGVAAHNQEPTPLERTALAARRLQTRVRQRQGPVYIQR